MQARGLRVVAHLHLRAEGHQPVQRLALGGPGVDGGDDAQGLARAAVRRERLHQHAQAVPADEGAEQVDAVGGGDFVRQSMCQGRLAAGVDEEVRGGERDQRAREVAVLRRVARDRAHCMQLLGREGDGVAGVDGVLHVGVAAEERDDAVGDLALVCRFATGREPAQSAGNHGFDVAGESGMSLGGVYGFGVRDRGARAASAPSSALSARVIRRS